MPSSKPVEMILPTEACSRLLSASVSDRAAVDLSASMTSSILVLRVGVFGEAF